MKKFLYTGLSLLLMSSVNAQPVLSDIMNYSIPDTLHYIQADTNGFNPGASGANVTWDFSSMNAHKLVKAYVKSPANSSHGSTFNNATYVETLDNGDEIYVNNGASYVVEGVVQNGVLIEYPNPRNVLTRPVTYNDNFVDTFTTKYTVSSYNLEGTGVSNTLVDGYGTLQLPNDTFNNVIRIKATFTQSDTVVGLPLLVANTTGTSYYWYDSFHKQPLVRVEEIDITSPVQNARIYVISYININPPGVNVESVINEDTEQFSAFVNNGQLHINGNLQTGADYSFEVYNQHGQVLLHLAFVGNGSQHYSTAIPELPQGIYILSVTKDGGKPSTIKLIN